MTVLPRMWTTGSTKEGGEFGIRIGWWKQYIQEVEDEVGHIKKIR